MKQVTMTEFRNKMTGPLNIVQRDDLIKITNEQRGNMVLMTESHYNKLKSEAKGSKEDGS